MKASFFAKLLATALLALCAHLATSIVMQRSRRAYAVAVNPSAKSKFEFSQTTVSKVVDGPAIPATQRLPFELRRQNLANPNVVNFTQLIDSKVETNGLFAHILVRGYLHEKRPNVVHIWSLRVVNPETDLVISERHYEHQLFRVPQGGESMPTFDEMVLFDPGTYRVEVAVYGIPEGYEVASLKEPSFARSFMCFKSADTISIKN